MNLYFGRVLLIFRKQFTHRNYSGSKKQKIWGTSELLKNKDDSFYWTSDAWKADWQKMGDHEIIKPATEADQKAEWAAGWEYNVNENIGRVRYIRLVIKNSNWQGSNCVNIGEITLWGDDL